MTTAIPAYAPTTDGYALYHRIFDHGGYTIDPQTGEIPRSGFAVSLPGYGRAIPEESFRPADTIQGRYRAQDAQRLHPEYRVYAGAWHDASSGLVYLDASVIVERQACAQSLAEQWRQEAYFDLGNNECVYTQTGKAA